MVKARILSIEQAYYKAAHLPFQAIVNKYKTPRKLELTGRVFYSGFYLEVWETEETNLRPLSSERPLVVYSSRDFYISGTHEARP